MKATQHDLADNHVYLSLCESLVLSHIRKASECLVPYGCFRFGNLETQIVTILEELIFYVLCIYGTESDSKKRGKP